MGKIMDRTKMIDAKLNELNKLLIDLDDEEELLVDTVGIISIISAISLKRSREIVAEKPNKKVI